MQTETIQKTLSERVPEYPNAIKIQRLPNGDIWEITRQLGKLYIGRTETKMSGTGIVKKKNVHFSITEKELNGQFKAYFKKIR